MYPSRGPRKSDVDQMFQVLAGNGSVHASLVDYFKALFADEMEESMTLAIGALSRPDLSHAASVKVGRSELLRDLVTFIESFKP